MYRVLFFVVVILAVALGLLVGTLNSANVSVDLLWVRLDWPLGLILLIVGLAFPLARWMSAPIRRLARGEQELIRAGVRTLLFRHDREQVEQLPG